MIRTNKEKYMLQKIAHRLFLLTLLASLIAGCNLPNAQEWLIQEKPVQEAPPEAPKLSTPQPALPKTVVTFFVEVPILEPVLPADGIIIEPASATEPPAADVPDPNQATPTETIDEEELEQQEEPSVDQAEQTIFFTILDEVTGLALNSQSQLMQLVPSDVLHLNPGHTIVCDQRAAGNGLSRQVSLRASDGFLSRS